MSDLVKKHFKKSFLKIFCGSTIYIVSDYCIIVSQISKLIFTSWEETSQLPV